jgi:hypothetical protein
LCPDFLLRSQVTRTCRSDKIRRIQAKSTPVLNSLGRVNLVTGTTSPIQNGQNGTKLFLIAKVLKVHIALRPAA